MMRSGRKCLVAGVLSVLPMAWPLAAMGAGGEVERFVGLTYVVTPDAREGRQRLDLVTGTGAFAPAVVAAAGARSTGSLTLLGSGEQASLHQLALTPSWQGAARIAVPLALTAAGVYVFAEAFLDDDDDDGDRRRRQDDEPTPAAPEPEPESPSAAPAGPLAQLLEDRNVSVVINGEAFD